MMVMKAMTLIKRGNLKIAAPFVDETWNGRAARAGIALPGKDQARLGGLRVPLGGTWRSRAWG